MTERCAGKAETPGTGRPAGMEPISRVSALLTARAGGDAFRSGMPSSCCPYLANRSPEDRFRKYYWLRGWRAAAESCLSVSNLAELFTCSWAICAVVPMTARLSTQPVRRGGDGRTGSSTRAVNPFGPSSGQPSLVLGPAPRLDAPRLTVEDHHIADAEGANFLGVVRLAHLDLPFGAWEATAGSEHLVEVRRDVQRGQAVIEPSELRVIEVEHDFVLRRVVAERAAPATPDCLDVVQDRPCVALPNAHAATLPTAPMFDQFLGPLEGARRSARAPRQGRESGARNQRRFRRESCGSRTSAQGAFRAFVPMSASLVASTVGDR